MADFLTLSWSANRNIKCLPSNLPDFKHEFENTGGVDEGSSPPRTKFS